MEIKNIKLMNNSIFIDLKKNSKQGFEIRPLIKNNEIVYSLFKIVYGNGGTIEPVEDYKSLEEAINYCYDIKKNKIIYKENPKKR